jgi:hypothetical protein
VIVVEHDEEAIESADYVVDIGPGAGEHGGRIVGRRHAGAGGGQQRIDDRRLTWAGARSRSRPGASPPNALRSCASAAPAATT